MPSAQVKFKPPEPLIGEPFLLSVAHPSEEFRLLSSYPIEDGWIVCELTTSNERLSQFRDELEETGFIFEVVWVTQSGDPVALLTDRQREFISEAIALGYYDTPRQCSLTELAAELDVSKSTVSVVLHNAEETIIKEFFSESIEQKEIGGN